MGFKDLFKHTLKNFQEAEEIKPYIPTFKNVYSFYSPKAGAGATSMLVHVANELHTEETPVCILDLNMAIPQAFPYFLGYEGIPQQQSIHDAFTRYQPDFLEYVIQDNPAHPFIVSAVPQLIRRNYSDTPPSMLENLIGTLSKKFTYVLIDIPSDMNYEGHLVGIGRSVKTYTFFQSDITVISHLISVMQELDRDPTIYWRPNAIKDVILCQVTDSHLDITQFSEIGLNPIGITQFDAALQIAFQSSKLVVPQKSAAIGQFFKVVSVIAEDIRAITMSVMGGDYNS